MYEFYKVKQKKPHKKIQTLHKIPHIQTLIYNVKSQERGLEESEQKGKF